MMEAPLFSQIPSVVIKKFKPEKRKIVKFIDYEVSSAGDRNTEVPLEVVKSDAMVQTDPGPELVTVGTQTTESFVSDSEYDYYKAQIQAQSSSLCKPMYSIPKNGDKNPPLKIGLSLPKGKKRKIFYPDDSDDE